MLGLSRRSSPVIVCPPPKKVGVVALWRKVRAYGVLINCRNEEDKAIARHYGEVTKGETLIAIRPIKEGGQNNGRISVMAIRPLAVRLAVASRKGGV